MQLHSDVIIKMQSGIEVREITRGKVKVFNGNSIDMMGVMRLMQEAAATEGGVTDPDAMIIVIKRPA